MGININKANLSMGVFMNDNVNGGNAKFLGLKKLQILHNIIIFLLAKLLPKVYRYCLQTEMINSFLGVPKNVSRL